MLKNILKLNGVQKLSKRKQNVVKGGVVFTCSGVEDGTPCVGINGIQTCINGYCDC